MDQNRLALLALHFVPGIGDFLVRQLVSYCGSAEDVFKLPKSKLIKIPGVGASTISTLKSSNPFLDAEHEIKKAEKADTRILFYLDADYPQRLKQFDDSPTLLYVKGSVNLNASKTVGIVGTRQATSYGKEMVEKLITELVPHQPLIISGLAYGIDIQAHKLALQKNLSTLGVMGSGMDVIYPSVHKDTAMKMLEHGGLVTENPFGTKPDAHNFPARNRIIAGLSDALIVVEAAEKGGALITAEIANNYNKDVFAIPGAVGQTYSAGCNKLIKVNKAHLLTGIKDIEYIMNWNPSEPITTQGVSQLDLNLFDPDELVVINMLREKKNAMVIDELSRKTSLSPSVLASLLLNLEFKNIVRSLPGKLYKLNKL
ncbi:MAG TPA: DNA-protecting protein DprA [Cytophagales bacterium]|nr:DNA-protecting protein DprA [Cytophagales bacterium]